MNNYNIQYRRIIPGFTSALANDFADNLEISKILFEEDRMEVIVKYSGDISKIAKELGAEVEILLQGYAIINIDKDKIPKLYSYQEVESIELPKNFYIASAYNLISTCVKDVQDSRRYNLQGDGTIVAIIDSGIDYTHPDFINEDGSSRILYLWDQSEKGIPPAGFVAGAEYDQAQINEALNSTNPLNVVDSVDFVGHGTAVAGIAAGNGRASNGANVGVAPNAEMIVVKVGKRGVRSFARTTELMRAMKYVLEKARQLNKPVAINMSFGMNNGSHLGTSIFETYLTDISSEWKCSIIIPTGNEGSAAHHFAAQVGSNQTVDIEFFTAAGITNFYLTMWKSITNSLSVEIIFPDESSSGVINIENQIKNVRMKNLLLTVIYGQPSHYSVNQEIFFNVKAITGTISPGLWILRLVTENVVDGRFDIWLPTTEEVTEETQFTNPSVLRTMTIPSTAKKIIAVAGYNDLLGNIAEFSGTGCVNIELPNPDIAAPAVDILSTKSGGGYDTYTGTSMAAPFVTGSAALMMQWGIVNNQDPFLYGERVKAFLRLGANRAAGTIYPNPKFGYGTLCLSNTMSYLERYFWGGENVWIQA